MGLQTRPCGAQEQIRVSVPVACSPIVFSISDGHLLCRFGIYKAPEKEAVEVSLSDFMLLVRGLINDRCIDAVKIDLRIFDLLLSSRS